MSEETTISSQEAIAAILVLQDEVNNRIKHGDGDLEALNAVIWAFESSDRIVIRTYE